MGAQIFQKSRSHFNILSARRVTCRTFRTEDPQILSATIQNLVARASGSPGFVYPCLTSSYFVFSLDHFTVMMDTRVLHGV